MKNLSRFSESQDLINIFGEVCGDEYKEFLDNSINKEKYDALKFYNSTK